MPPGTPGWWYGSGASLMPVLLEPVALVWRMATWARRKLISPYRSSLPVICIGNPTAGGAGKTPTALALAAILEELGESPLFLTRGYGGRVAGPHLVDPATDSAEDVGDEALLLVRLAPTIVCADRAAGARFAESLHATVVVMDDGFHNPGLAKDLSILVVDRASGIGNAQVMPAGPLREELTAQLARAHAMLLTGHGGAADGAAAEARQAGLPVFDAVLKSAEDTGWLKGAPVIAFAGIGRPQKFFCDLEAAGAKLKQKFAFPDHHQFTERDAARLLAAADRHNAVLVTTEKDQLRLQTRGARLEALRARARPYPVKLVFCNKKGMKTLVKQVISTNRKN